MRIYVLPILFGFFLLGALSHEGVNLIKGQGTAVPTPAPMRLANEPKQLRALADGVGAADMDDAHAEGIAPLPAFVPEQDGGSCASGASAHNGQQICVWAI